MNVAAVVDAPGLTSAEAEARRAAGLDNVVADISSRRVVDIVRANVLTRFNAIITALAVVVLLVGDPIDAVFAGVMILNSGIGIVQEVRAKRSLDALRLLVEPRVVVRRDGVEVETAPAGLVLGDVIRLDVGDQLPVDGTVIATEGLEVDESALTGESDPVAKANGDDVMSGSAVVGGVAWIEAIAVGEDTWIRGITREAKDFVLTQSELRRGIDSLLRVIGWLLTPLGALLVWSQLRSSSSVSDGLVWSVAGMVALVPQGLVLLVSLALAVAVIRLGRQQVVVQELPAVEGLARVDLLCVDKTGTLTTGRFRLDGIDPLGPTIDEVQLGLAALTGVDGTTTPTTAVIRDAVIETVDDPAWAVTGSVPFTSARKWSGASFADRGTWVLGAPEILMDAMGPGRASHLRDRVAAEAATGRRILLLARAPGDLSADDDQLPARLDPAAIVSLREEVRPDAAETLEYFRRQNVDIKVISGDHPRTVAAVADELGVTDSDRFVDARELGTELGADLADTVVFGRVQPEQKRDLVRAFQSAGRTVAMTGDGVNDIPSLKAADIGIAMNTATPATKAVSQLVLVDGRFARMPSVVSEGRRVIANMERVSALFVTKTVYAGLLALAVGLAGVPFPFLPRHFSLIGAVTIGIPAFALSFRAADRPCRPGYLRRVLHFAVPAGVVCAAATLAAYALLRSSVVDADLVQARTGATMTLTAIGLWIIYRLVAPLGLWELLMLLGLGAGFGVLLVPSRFSDFYALDLPPDDGLVWLAALVAGVAVVVEIASPRARRRHRKDSS